MKLNKIYEDWAEKKYPLSGNDLNEINSVRYGYVKGCSDMTDVVLKFLQWAFTTDEWRWTGETWDENTGHDDFEQLSHAELFAYFLEHIYNKTT